MEYKCLYHKPTEKYISEDMVLGLTLSGDGPNDLPNLVPNTDYFNYEQDFFLDGDLPVYDPESDEQLFVKKEDCEVHVFTVTLKEKLNLKL